MGRDHNPCPRYWYLPNPWKLIRNLCKPVVKLRSQGCAGGGIPRTGMRSLPGAHLGKLDALTQRKCVDGSPRMNSKKTRRFVYGKSRNWCLCCNVQVKLVGLEGRLRTDKRAGFGWTKRRGSGQDAGTYGHKIMRHGREGHSQPRAYADDATVEPLVVELLLEIICRVSERVRISGTEQICSNASIAFRVKCFSFHAFG